MKSLIDDSVITFNKTVCIPKTMSINSFYKKATYKIIIIFCKAFHYLTICFLLIIIVAINYNYLKHQFKF